MATDLKCKEREQSRKPAKLIDILQYILIHITYILSQTSSSHFTLISDHRNEREYYVHYMTKHITYYPEDL